MDSVKKYLERSDKIKAQEKLEEFKTIAQSIFKKTQDFFDFRTQLDGEIKVGNNWSDTH